MKHLKTKFLKKQIAEDEKLLLSDVDRIIDAHFEFVKEVISTKVDREENIFPSVRLRNFAIFFCTESKKKWMTKLNNKRKEDGTVSV